MGKPNEHPVFKEIYEEYNKSQFKEELSFYEFAQLSALFDQNDLLNESIVVMQEFNETLLDSMDTKK